VGITAQLAGMSVLLFSVALAALPWALVGRRPGRGIVAALVVAELVVTDMGVAMLRSGLHGTVVHPGGADLTIGLWLLALPMFLAWLAALSRRFAATAAVLLILGSPLVAAFSYAIGSFDARPWYEAVMGVFVGGAGACLLVEAALRPAQHRELRVEPAVT
jgi:hypothetical protein